MEAPDARDRVVIPEWDAAGEKGLAQIVEISYGKGGMRFARGAKVFFNSDVELLRTALEPAAATGLKRGRLRNFAHAEETAIEFASSEFAAFRGSYLQVVKTRDSKFHVKREYLRKGDFVPARKDAKR
jgi:hypothetical protein